jgi:aquaporin Z
MRLKKYTAEAIGTFALVFCGAGAIAINETSNGAVGHLGIAMTFGLIVLAMIYTLGDISGAHLNPAVTLGFWLSKRFPAKEILPYILSQAIGAFIASGVVYYLFPDSKTFGATIPAGSNMQSFVLEIILTFILMFVIIHVSSGSKEQGLMAGIAVGSVVGLEAMFAGPISGASMNPVRSLAPAVFSGEMHSLWVYLIAPFIGAVLAILSFNVIRK